MSAGVLRGLLAEERRLRAIAEEDLRVVGAALGIKAAEVEELRAALAEAVRDRDRWRALAVPVDDDAARAVRHAQVERTGGR